ncbi:MAG: DUF2330 domain-containing protein [Sorangiineae bacterium]|nr:DUF2330 domain-containing protein [Polyangiaceae bacterium]MEB2323344.1 DUF2330 domain-containing protein [Sorangiineae bacterium]
MRPVTAGWLLLLFGLAGAPGRARALGLALSPDGAARVTELRVALAEGGARRTLWSELTLACERGEVAVLLPVAPGALLDPAGDEWFAALDAATAPRIVPRGVAPAGCATTPRVEVTLAAEPRARLEPRELAEFDSVDEVERWAVARGLALDGAASARLARAGTRFVGLVYDAPSGGGTTAPVRVVEPALGGGVPLSLAARPGAPVPVTVFTLTGGARALAPGMTLDASRLGPTWRWRSGSSDYADRSAVALEEAVSALWLEEARSPALLFDLTLLPGAAGATPPVVGGYLQRAAASRATDCAAAADAARRLDWRVAEACPAGVLARVRDDAGAEPPCVEAVAPGETDPATLRCDGADDLALGLAGSRPNEVVVLRARGLVTASDPMATLEPTDTPNHAPIIVAARTDAAGCEPASGTGGASGQDPGGGVTGAGQGGGASAPRGERAGGSDQTVQVALDAGCDWGSSSSSDGSACSGDSSSSSSDGATCSGDSSSSSSDGSDCSGDSSSSSSDGATCSGDSSSSSSDGATCSGDSSSGSEDGCSGGSEGSEGDTCSLSRRRGRPRASVLLLGLAAVAFPLRRASRRSRPPRT